jgi:hypothetical protein
MLFWNLKDMCGWTINFQTCISLKPIPSSENKYYLFYGTLIQENSVREECFIGVVLAQEFI